MLSIGKMTGGREGYYLDALSRTQDEYYLNPTETPGRWQGRLAQQLGLDGVVDADSFRTLLAGRHPQTGTPLVANSDDLNRVTGFDLTFSAPKSVSLLWALGDDHMSRLVAEAHDAAVSDALGMVETEATFARRGHNGLTRLAGDGLVAAGFGHRTSRAGDPQLHTHLVVANLTRTADGHWSAPDGRLIYGWAKTVGFAYQASLRHHLTTSLGVAWAPVTRGVAELEGITRTQRQAFSTRRQQIEVELAAHGATSMAAARAATLATRPGKDRQTNLTVLRDEWREQALDLGLDVEALRHSWYPHVPHGAPDVTRSLLTAEGLTAQSTSFDRRDVVQSIAARHASGVPTATLADLTNEVLADAAVITLGGSAPVTGRRFTTAELLQVESHLIAHAVSRQSEGVGRVRNPSLQTALSDRPMLSDEQRTMIARLTTSGAGVDVVIGRAGAGKTFALDAARHAWQADGYTVIGTALAAKAAAGLQAGTGIRSATTDRLLGELDHPEPLGGLTSRTVIVVDEAGMIGTRKLDRLATHAAQAGAKLVLVGDPRQLPEIDAGGGFASLARRLDPIRLDENRRQTETWEREALNQLRSGTVSTAVEAYNDRGRIHLSRSADQARQALVDAWWEARAGGKDAAMYALSRADVADLNHRARQLRKDAGELSGVDVDIDGTPFAPGDSVLCLRNDRRLMVRNGTAATLIDVGADQATIRLADATIRTLTSDYLHAGNLTHGYAATIHKAQGVTVDDAFLLGSDQLYREAGYVALSRARHSSHLFVVDSTVPDLTRTLQVSRAQTLARDQHPQRGVEHSSARRAALLADPPSWAVNELGPPPLRSGLQQDRWADAVIHLDVLRARHQIRDPERALGSTPDRTGDDFLLARTLLDQARTLHQGLSR